MVVDASETWVGAMEPDLKCEPKSFSKNFSPAGRNYNIRNRELLAVKLALEMLHHWLEGPKHLFVIYTNPKNLEYLKTAK